MAMSITPETTFLKMETANQRAFKFFRVGFSPFQLYLKSALSPNSFNSLSFPSQNNTPSAVSKAMETAMTEHPDEPVRIVALVGEGTVSPLKSAKWEEVMLHTVKRLKWIDEGYEMTVLSNKLCRSSGLNLQKKLLYSTDILVIVAVNDEESVKWIQANSKNIPNIICFDSSMKLVNKLGGRYVESEGAFSKILGSPERKESMEVVRAVSEAWNRKALQCLNQCNPVDQVCNYRCIASYENPNLEAFSLCVLQKNNCLELDAKIPERPYVPPMVKFRGRELCHETAEDLLVGWLGSLDWSWRVIAGQNPAYDQFPCQYQLFYRGKARGSFWYEPVFQVNTLEGKLVWRRRKYRVKRGKIPGTFYFSVLDNGVVSNEFWTIVDVSDDLSWGLFHYSGAARVAGQSYTGAVLVSPDGSYPNQKKVSRRLNSALESSGIKEWEVFTVDNCSCHNPPLGIPEGSSNLLCKIDIKDKDWASLQQFS